MSAIQRSFVGPRRVLVIAGSDSSGGAGLEADQKVTAAHGCYAMTATTALTAQNTQGVSAIFEVPPEFVVKQIDQCINDIGVDVVKIGMLASASTAGAVAEALQRHGNPPTVLDPVMVSTSGAQLLPDTAISTLLKQMLPITTILTPNIPEAKLLLQHAGQQPPEISSLSDLVSLAKMVHSLGPQSVLLKGGHFPISQNPIKRSESEQFIADVLVTTSSDTKQESGLKITVFQAAYISTSNTHGTGCSLASAIACNLAMGHNMLTAVGNSVQYIEKAILAGKDWRLGHGNGPIDHLFAARKTRIRESGVTEAEHEVESTVSQWDWEENDGRDPES